MTTENQTPENKQPWLLVMSKTSIFSEIVSYLQFSEMGALFSVIPKEKYDEEVVSATFRPTAALLTSKIGLETNGFELLNWFIATQQMGRYVSYFSIPPICFFLSY